MSKSHLLKYLLISPNLPVGGFCYSEGLESYLNTKDLKDSNSVKELIISELKIGQIRLDAKLLLDFTKKPSTKKSKKDYNPEEEFVGDFKPLVNLPEVKVSTGEENEEILLEIRSKFYRWDDD